MKNDSSRDTFRARKHYSRVMIQQGRLQVDADWNEQGEIIGHRIETETSDTIGMCGGPLHDAGFHIVPGPAQLSTEEKARPENGIVPAKFAPPDFLIGAGRYYVDGILCSNDTLTSYAKQPDLPAAIAIGDPGLYLVYLDVWQRHLTALDDPSIREVALGGPDTATRVKTVWQAKHLFLGAAAKGTCLSKFADFDAMTAAPNGTLMARTKQEQISQSPCIVPPGAGYRGLENQLYRVEVHQGGPALKVTTAPVPVKVMRVANTTNQVRFTGGKWKAGQAIEFVSSDRGAETKEGTIAYITAVNSRSKALTLNVNVSTIDLDKQGLLPADATFKWSRDNGSVVTSIENIDGFEVTVHDLGPDAVLGFKEDQWVEISDDVNELNGEPGLLARIVKIDRAINLVTLNVAPPSLGALSGVPDTSAHPKMRRWDGVASIKFHPDGSDENDLELENGVMIRFGAGAYRTGDYWTIPARTATADAQSGNIEWPMDAAGKGIAQRPFGVRHHYCRLAMLHWDGTQFDIVEDCRRLFPPITELTNLLYVSGDGQEAMPGDPLPQLLQVGVFNGRWPVEGARVRFVAEGNGRVEKNKAALPASTTNSTTVLTGVDGIASCAWRLEPDVTKPSQQVETRLLDADGNPVPSMVIFNGNLSIADQVAYDPKQCGDLAKAGVTTVQQALDALCKQTERGIRIERILTGGRERLLNDTLVPVSRLEKGITILCDAKVDPVAVGISPDPASNFPDAVAAKPTCFVTLDLPYPLVDGDRKFWKIGTFGFQPLILSCTVIAKNNEIHWQPSENANGWLQNRLFGMLSEGQIADRILAHLTLKGNFIWSRDARDKSLLYLDGEAFGVESVSKRIDLVLPTGDGHKGGDFEMWFWLVKELSNVILDATASASAKSILGAVRDISGAPLPSVTVTLTVAATGQQMSVATNPQGEFRFSGLASGTYEVSVEVEGSTVRKTVVL